MFSGELFHLKLAALLYTGQFQTAQVNKCKIYIETS